MRSREVLMCSVAEDPVAADAVVDLVAVERQAAAVQDLRGGDAAGARADDADARQGAGAHRATLLRAVACGNLAQLDVHVKCRFG
jgi:hypothetical protein